MYEEDVEEDSADEEANMIANKSEAGDEDEDEGEEVVWQVRPSTHLLYTAPTHDIIPGNRRWQVLNRFNANLEQAIRDHNIDNLQLNVFTPLTKKTSSEWSFSGVRLWNSDNVPPGVSYI